MADHRGPARPRDARRVDASQEHELRYWAQKWNVPPERLRAAVGRVGPVADDVARELGADAAAEI